MYLRHLKIVEDSGVIIRNVKFKNGLNIVVDESKDEKGNNVGKTTFLKLIDICLGAKDKKYIWTDNETGSTTTDLKDYINDNRVYVELAVDIDKATHLLKVELYDRGSRYINDERYSYNDYTEKLNQLFFSIQKPPTFRQLISKFVRIKQKTDDHSTLKYLNQNTTNSEYRNIYEFLFKLDTLENSTNKLQVNEKITKLKEDLANLFRLHQFKDLEDLKTRKKIVNNTVKELQAKIDTFIDTNNYKKTLKNVTEVKNKLNLLNDNINGALFKKSKIEDILSKEEHEEKIDLGILKEFYLELKKDFSDISKEFQDLVDFNTKIKQNKIKYYKKRIAEIESDIQEMQAQRDKLVNENKDAISLINEDNFHEFDKYYQDLIKQSEMLGELNKVESIYEDLTEQLKIEEEYLDEINKNSKLSRNNLYIFNKYFTKYSQEILDQRLYTSYQKDGFPINLSNVDHGIGTGYRKTITLLLDIAYVSFINELKLNYPKFIVHDVLEIIDEHNFKKIINLVKSNRTQFIFGVLNEKIKNYTFINESDKILKLSKDDKLFKI